MKKPVLIPVVAALTVAVGACRPTEPTAVEVAPEPTVSEQPAEPAVEVVAAKPAPEVVVAPPQAEKKTSTPAGFTDDYDAAMAQAKESGKPIYVVFTGSDWCHWCKVLEGDYLSKPEFVAEAGKHFILLFIDNPRDAGLLSDKAKAQNQTLTRKYGVRGFPTVMFFTPEGKVLTAKRPHNMTPQAYAQSLKAQYEIHPLIDQHLGDFSQTYSDIVKPYREAMNKAGNVLVLTTDEEIQASLDTMKRAATLASEQMQELHKQLSAAQIPAAIEKDRADFLSAVSKAIESFQANIKKASVSVADIKAMKEAVHQRNQPKQ